MINLFELKETVIKEFDKSAELVKNFGYTASAESILEIKESFKNKEIIIVTVGKLNRGKSSLLN